VVHGGGPTAGVYMSHMCCLHHELSAKSGRLCVANPIQPPAQIQIVGPAAVSMLQQQALA
jgi:hypothetical protein